MFIPLSLNLRLAPLLLSLYAFRAHRAAAIPVLPEQGSSSSSSLWHSHDPLLHPGSSNQSDAGTSSSIGGDMPLPHFPEQLGSMSLQNYQQHNQHTTFYHPQQSVGSHDQQYSQYVDMTSPMNWNQYGLQQDTAPSYSNVYHHPALSSQSVENVYQQGSQSSQDLLSDFDEFGDMDPAELHHLLDDHTLDLYQEEPPNAAHTDLSSRLTMFGGGDPHRSSAKDVPDIDQLLRPRRGTRALTEAKLRDLQERSDNGQNDDADHPQLSTYEIRKRYAQKHKIPVGSFTSVHKFEKFLHTVDPNRDVREQWIEKMASSMEKKKAASNQAKKKRLTEDANSKSKRKEGGSPMPIGRPPRSSNAKIVRGSKSSSKESKSAPASTESESAPNGILELLDRNPPAPVQGISGVQPNLFDNYDSFTRSDHGNMFQFAPSDPRLFPPADLGDRGGNMYDPYWGPSHQS